MSSRIRGFHQRDEGGTYQRQFEACDAVLSNSSDAGKKEKSEVDSMDGDDSTTTQSKDEEGDDLRSRLSDGPQAGGGESSSGYSSDGETNAALDGLCDANGDLITDVFAPRASSNGVSQQYARPPRPTSSSSNSDMSNARENGGNEGKEDSRSENFEISISVEKAIQLENTREYMI